MSEPVEQETRVPAGEQLKHLREQKNLSIQDIATRLNLEVRIIEAVESNKFQDLPAATYVRGYLRSYAKILGVEPEAIVSSYNYGAPEPPEIIPEVRHSTQTSSSDKPVRAISYLVTLTLVILLVAWLYSNYLVDTQSSLVTDHGNEVEDVVPGLDYDILVVEHPTMPFYRDIDASEDGLLDLAEAESDPDIVDDEVEADPDNVEEYPAMVTSDNEGPDSLVLNISQDSWVEIHDSLGNKIFVNLARQGQTLLFQGTAPFEILLGFAEGVKLEINGDTFDTAPYTKGAIARFSLDR